MGEKKMHDTFLLKRITESLNEICKINKIVRVDKLKIITNPNSHIHEDNLYEHLKEGNPELIGDWTEIVIVREDIEALTAIIDSVEGEKIAQ